MSEQVQPTLSSKDKVDQMISGLRRGKDIHEMFAETVRTGILIQGKTMEQWRDYFTIKLTNNPDTGDCKVLDMKLMSLHQEATFLKCMAEAALTLGKKSYDTQYRDKFTALVSEYKSLDKKLPAKETLEILASNDLDDIETGVSYSELGVKFWKDILDDLNYKRRAVENITINLSVEAKANAASGLLQNRKDTND
jgi:hypothetical protein